jgi:repressor LexA
MISKPVDLWSEKMPKMGQMALSASQRNMLAFIRERTTANGYPPTQQEIADAFGFKWNSTVRYHLRALEQAEELDRTPHAARTLRVVHRDPRVRGDQLRLTILGHVAAGVPIGANLASDERVVMDRTLFSSTPDYLLRVKGHSMRDDAILDGDLVAIKRTNNARNGQVVVARIEDEITIKRLKINTRGIWLLPRNPDFEPIAIREEDDFAIEGIFCGLVRKG